MKDRNKKILEQYKNGQTLEELAKSYKVSRSRVQQIVIREMEKDIVERLHISYNLFGQDREMLKVAAHEEISQIAADRENNNKHSEREGLVNKIKASTFLQDLSNFPTVDSYSKAMGVSLPTLKKFFPDTVAKINQQRKAKWSWQYEKCLMCGTTSTPHRNKGYCKKCYPKSDLFKMIIKKSFLRHKEARVKKMKEYMEEYNTRPEVIKRYKKQNDENNFGGNRQKALERDGFKCTNCGITQEESYKKFSRDLFVEHKEGKSNELGNLNSVCQGCHNEKIIRMAREIGSENLFQKYMRLYNNKKQ